VFVGGLHDDRPRDGSGDQAVREKNPMIASRAATINTRNRNFEIATPPMTPNRSRTNAIAKMRVKRASFEISRPHAGRR
jgi:hypothetical protein